MKKTTQIGATIALTALILAGITASCKKESIAKKKVSPITNVENTENGVPPKPVQGNATEKGPIANGTITMGYSCGGEQSCLVIGVGPNPPKYNKFTFSKDSYTSSFYPSLRYTIYKPVGGGAYQRMVEWVCNSNPVSYANSVLLNGTTYYVTLTDPTTPAPPLNVPSTSSFQSATYSFITGNYGGQWCGEGPPKGK